MSINADVGLLAITEQAALTLHSVLSELRRASLRADDWGIRCEHPEGFPTQPPTKPCNVRGFSCLVVLHPNWGGKRLEDQPNEGCAFKLERQRWAY